MYTSIHLVARCVLPTTTRSFHHRGVKLPSPPAVLPMMYSGQTVLFGQTRNRAGGHHINIPFPHTTGLYPKSIIIHEVANLLRTC